MNQHHPDQNILAEYVAGSLDKAQAVAVSAHLHFCTKCRRAVQEMQQIGGAMLEELEPAEIHEHQFDQLMSAIANQPAQDMPSQPKDVDQLPHVVSKLINQKPLKWRKVTSSLRTANLVAGQNQYAISLQKIQAASSVPEHDHRGTEITVVLKGSFSDNEGIYQEGDFILKEPGEIHKPLSAGNQDCLCLSVESAPVKLTGMWGRLLNPFIRIKAA